MSLTDRIPDLTDQMLAATLRAAEDPAHTAGRWLLLAETERLERCLRACYEELGYRVTPPRSAA